MQRFMREKRIYADAAASTPLHPRVIKRMSALMGVYGNPGALHREALMASEELERARREVAETIGAHPDEIIFTGSGTESNNLAIMGVLTADQGSTLVQTKVEPWSAVTLPIEHASVLEPLAHSGLPPARAGGAQAGAKIIQVPVGENGVVSPKDVYEAIMDDTVLVSIQMINSEIGTIQGVREIAKVVRRVRTLRQAHCKQAQDKKSGESVLPLVFHVDAAQAPLWLPLKVDSLGVDLMTLDAQKIQGPKGVGVLYRRRGVALAPIMRGGTQESGLRPGTENCVTAAGFAEALMIAQKDVEKRAEKIAAVRDYLLSEIQKTISDVLVNGTMTDRAPNNLNISISGLEGEVAVIALDAMGVAASTRSACSTEEENPSHVLAALGYDRTRALEAIRFTLLPDATKSDAKRIAQALKEVCRLYRKQNN